MTIGKREFLFDSDYTILLQLLHIIRTVITLLLVKLLLMNCLHEIFIDIDVVAKVYEIISGINCV